MAQTYTHTEEGKYVLTLLSNIISTQGMEVYKCKCCDDLFGAVPRQVDAEEPVCGICEKYIRAECGADWKYGDPGYEED